MFKTTINKLGRAIEKTEKEMEVEDFCEEYQFDKIGDKEFFNDRFNMPGLKSYLFYDRTPDFFNDIDRQIYLQSNIDLMIYGPKGMGKSNILMKVMKYWQRRYYEIKSKQVNKYGLINYIGFSDSQIRSIIRIVTEGDILSRDESPISSGKGTRTDTNALQNFILQTREYQTSAIFVNPEKIENLSGIDYYIEVAGKRGIYICKRCNLKLINRKSCPACRRDTEILYNESKTRCIWYDRRGIIMGFLYIYLHDDEEFREAYHKKKVSNMKSTVIHGGEVSSQYDKEQFTNDLIKLFDFCIECQAGSLADIRTHLNNYNLQFDPGKEAEKIIVGNIEYINDIIRNVFNAIKGNLKGNPLKDYILEIRAELEDQDNEETHEDLATLDNKKNSGTRYHETMSFPDFCYLNIPDEKIGIVAKELAEGQSIRNIFDNHREEGLGYTYITQMSKLLRQEGYEYRLGYLFEKWNALDLGVPIEDLDTYVAGAEHIPDLIWEDKIYSFKVRINSISNTLAFYQSKDFAPEYEEAKKRNTTYIVRLFHPKWDQDLIIKEIDPIKDPEKIIFKKQINIKKLVL